MNTSFEMNNSMKDVVDAKYKANSPVVEVFSALVSGNDLSHFKDGVVDKSVKYISELASRAMAGDHMAVSEMNNIMRLSIEPKLLEAMKIFDFMGTYRNIGYDTVPMMRTYKYESVDSRFQASSGDVPFATASWREYPIGTQTISAGFAVDYRELQSGNFDGSIAEGMNQVQIDMNNKAVNYVIAVLYNAIANARGVKHFVQSTGITKTALDDMLAIMRRYGPVTITGDYAVVSQINGFAGYTTFPGNTTASRFGADAVAEEIRRTGLVNRYNGATVLELPNAFNYTEMNAGKTSYELYMPQGLLFLLPSGSQAPIQIFRRGGLTTMTGDDIVTRQHLTRFDMEIGAGVAEGMEDRIGLIADANFAVPQLP